MTLGITGTKSFQETLNLVLTRQLGEPIRTAVYEIQPLQGGTLGQVNRIWGQAIAADGRELPFQVVHKTQKKWMREFDPDSWRREYDLYASELAPLLCEALGMPRCYHQEITEEEMQLWMEYLEGVSGLCLTGEMLVQGAEALGRFQGKIAKEKPEISLTNLSEKAFFRKSAQAVRVRKEVAQAIRREDSGIPSHLRNMLLDVDAHWDSLWYRIERLPIVLCHRDFWVTNIFWCQNKLRLIDWDTTGWGYLGEDIASLIADEGDVSQMVDNYKRCVPAYYRGFSAYAEAPPLAENCVWEMMLLQVGYRLVLWHQFSQSPEAKQLQLDTLQQLYEIGRQQLGNES